MSQFEGHERPSDVVPHQDEVEDLVVEGVDAQLAATSDHVAIADVSVLEAQTPIEPVAAPSAGYVEAEALAARNAINFLITQGAATEANAGSLDAKVNEILDVLRDAGLIPAS